MCPRVCGSNSKCVSAWICLLAGMIHGLFSQIVEEKKSCLCLCLCLSGALSLSLPLSVSLSVSLCLSVSDSISVFLSLSLTLSLSVSLSLSLTHTEAQRWACGPGSAALPEKHPDLWFAEISVDVCVGTHRGHAPPIPSRPVPLPGSRDTQSSEGQETHPLQGGSPLPERRGLCPAHTCACVCVCTRVHACACAVSLGGKPISLPLVEKSWFTARDPLQTSPSFNPQGGLKTSASVPLEQGAPASLTHCPSAGRVCLFFSLLS